MIEVRLLAKFDSAPDPERRAAIQDEMRGLLARTAPGAEPVSRSGEGSWWFWLSVLVEQCAITTAAYLWQTGLRKLARSLRHKRRASASNPGHEPARTKRVIRRDATRDSGAKLVHKLLDDLYRIVDWDDPEGVKQITFGVYDDEGKRAVVVRIVAGEPEPRLYRFQARDQFNTMTLPPGAATE